MDLRRREPVLKIEKSIGITTETHSMLKALRKKKKKSMAQIVLELVLKEYLSD